MGIGSLKLIDLIAWGFRRAVVNMFFFQFLFPKVWKNWKFPIFHKSLEKFGKNFFLFFQFRNWKHLLLQCHCIEYYISSTCRNPATEERSQHNVHTERTSCHFPKNKSFSLFPKIFPKIFQRFSKDFSKVYMC